MSQRSCTAWVPPGLGPGAARHLAGPRHQLMWIIWYSGADVGHGGSWPEPTRGCRGTVTAGSDLGDSVAVLDGQTGRLITTLSGAP